MKQSKAPTSPQMPHRPKDTQAPPVHAQTEATAGREQVRESSARVTAPRESKRPHGQ